MNEKKEKKKLNFSVKVMIGLLLGAVAGVIFQRWPDAANTYTLQISQTWEPV